MGLCGSVQASVCTVVKSENITVTGEDVWSAGWVSVLVSVFYCEMVQQKHSFMNIL